MNHVSLIGKLEGGLIDYPEPSTNGRSMAQFKLITKSIYINKQGIPKERREKHDILVWGKFKQLMERLAQPEMQLAVEGTLLYRYRYMNGRLIKRAEIEANDLIIV
ncbi:MAG: single-stranded DNA-binding protein [Flavobacteriales bacterium]